METFNVNTRERIHTRTHIHSNDSCRIWTGPVKKGSNYGQIKYKDPIDGRYKTKGVHRVALMVSDKIRKLDIPANLVASHLCNNSLCVNVDHLNFEPQSVNNNRSICFSNSTCYGHGADLEGQPRPPCLIHLNDAKKSYLRPDHCEPQGNQAWSFFDT